MNDFPVLIVDDDPINLGLLDSILGDLHPLVAARNGADALKAATRHRPVLILLDVRMPDLDGFTVCARLKEDPATRDIPVIFVTALGDAWDESAGFQAGAVDYLVKPVSRETVLARVQTHLRLRSLEQERDALVRELVETKNRLRELHSASA